MTSHTIRHRDDRRDRDEASVESLMIPFAVVVLDVLRHGESEVPLSDRNQPVQAFFFGRPHEPLRVSICIRRAHRREDDADTRDPQSAPRREAPTECALPVPRQYARVSSAEIADAQVTRPVAEDDIRDGDRRGSASPRLGSLLETNGRVPRRRPQPFLNSPEVQAPSSHVAGRDCSA
jgi:hypothetical protein